MALGRLLLEPGVPGPHGGRPQLAAVDQAIAGSRTARIRGDVSSTHTFSDTSRNTTVFWACAAGERLRDIILEVLEDPKARDALGWLVAAAITQRLEES